MIGMMGKEAQRERGAEGQREEEVSFESWGRVSRRTVT